MINKLIQQTRYDYNIQIIKSLKPAINALRTSWSMFLNASYHMVYHYIWFMDGDLNGFPDIRPLMK